MNRYDIDELEQVFAPLKSSSPKASHTGEFLDGLPDACNHEGEMLAAIRDAEKGTEWRDRALKWTGWAAAKGRSKAEVEACAPLITQTGYTNSETQREIGQMFEGAVRKGYDKTGQKTTTLPLVHADSIQPQLTNNWLIKKFLPQIGCGLAYGFPGTAKSFIAIDMGMHVALGWPWAGRKVDQALVIYVAAEGENGMINRIAAFAQHHDVDLADAKFSLIPAPVDLSTDGEGADRLREAIFSAAEYHDEQPAMVVLDTLSKTFGGKDENGSDMAAYVSVMQSLASEFRCFTMAIHHRPKDSNNATPRGHSSLQGGVDTIMLIGGATDGTDRLSRNIKVTKQKDGDTGLEFSFKLKSVRLGNDEDGEAVTSCVVEVTDDFANVPIGAEDRVDNFQAVVDGLSETNRLVFETIEKSVLECGIEPPLDLSFDAAFSAKLVVCRKKVREACIAKMLENCGTSLRNHTKLLENCQKHPAKHLRNRLCDGHETVRNQGRSHFRAKINKALKALRSKDLCGFEDNYVWSNR